VHWHSFTIQWVRTLGSLAILLSMAVDHQRRGLHDRAAGTIVVREVLEPAR
jgi:uncharacterized RDD family membrane protein YckC